MNLWRISKIAALPDEGRAAPFRPVASPATTGRRGRHDRSSRPRRIYISPFTYIRLAPDVYMSPRVPPMELGSSTYGIREFHYWNSVNEAYFDDYDSSSYEL